VSVDGDFVGFGVFKTGVRQLVGNFAVVGEYHQAFGFGIQTPNHEQVTFNRDRLAYCRAVVFGVAFCDGKHVLGLVEHDIAGAVTADADALSVYAHLINFGVGLVAERGNNAVDGDALCLNHRFTGTPRAKIGACHELLYSFFHGGILILSASSRRTEKAS
jgi:hypothetical protein